MKTFTRFWFPLSLAICASPSLAWATPIERLGDQRSPQNMGVASLAIGKAGLPQNFLSDQGKLAVVPRTSGPGLAGDPAANDWNSLASVRRTLLSADNLTSESGNDAATAPAKLAKNSITVPEPSSWVLALFCLSLLAAGRFWLNSLPRLREV